MNMTGRSTVDPQHLKDRGIKDPVHRTLLSLMSLGVPAALFLAACGGNSEDQTSATSTVAVTPASTATPTLIPVATSTATPQPTSTPDLALTRQERLLEFASEAGLEPDILPDSLEFSEETGSPTMKEPYVRDDIRVYRATYAPPGRASISYNELVSKKSDRFEEDGLLLGNTIAVVFHRAINLTWDANTDFDSLLINNAFTANEQEIEEAELTHFTRLGSSVDEGDVEVWEKILNNSDGTKTSMWITLRRVRFIINGEVSVQFVGQMGATKIYPDNPFYGSDTAFDREPQEN